MIAVPKTVAIIQARLQSQRLPRKVLLELPPGSGITVLERVIQQAQKAHYIDEIVVAAAYGCEELVPYAIRQGAGIRVHNDPRRDVLMEFAHAACGTRAENIVRITADCPLISPDEIDRTIDAHIDAGADYTCNRNDQDDGDKGDGTDVEVFTVAALAKAMFSAKEPYDREHVTSFFRRGGFRVKKLSAPDIACRSLNTIQDYYAILWLYAAQRRTAAQD